MVCLTAGDAKAQVLNKIRLAEYVGSLNRILDYYEDATAPKPHFD